MSSYFRRFIYLGAACHALIFAQPAMAYDPCDGDKVCRVAINLLSVNPTEDDLNRYRDIADERGLDGLASYIIANEKEFTTVTLKSFAERWTERDGKPGRPLDDSILTIIVAIMTDIDFRRILYDDIIATGVGEVTGRTGGQLKLASGHVVERYYPNSNKHYLDLQKFEIYHLLKNVKLVSQKPGTHKTLSPIAGVFSTSGFGRVAFKAGTNRAAVEMVLREALGLTMEDVKDASASEKYIQRAVARVDGKGSSELFNKECRGCHSILDSMATAFIHYDLSNGSTPSVKYSKVEPIPPSNKQMKIVFTNGFIPGTDQWFADSFSDAQKQALGWNSGSGGGFGAASLGKALSETDAFLNHQTAKAFNSVCGRLPGKNDKVFVDRLAKKVKESGFRIKQAFAKSAVYCAGGEG